MQSKAKNVKEYLKEVPEERQEAIHKLRDTILNALPKGFEETMNYGMIGYVVPHSRYPAGYHCSPELPLPFMALASQKNCLSFYHMGIYAKKELLDWFIQSYPNYSKSKLDMGKSCIRFKKINDIPYELIAQLVKKISVADWIKLYEDSLKTSS